MVVNAKFLNSIAHATAPSFTTLHPSANPYLVTHIVGGSTGLSVGDTIMSWRGPATGLTLLHCIRVFFIVTTAFGSQTLCTVEFSRARSFTASDTGGTAATLTGNTGKLRTNDPTTTIQDFRIASGAGLTPGTRTLDTSPFSVVSGNLANGTGIGLNATTVCSLYTDTAVPQYPVLGPNEGIVAKLGFANYPLTGVVTWGFVFGWQEMPAGSW